jgi:predicted cupin superfamily sugar epimerase
VNPRAPNAGPPRPAPTGAAALVEALGLRAHPEGGYYRETFRSEQLVATPRGPRSALTTILFLLTAGSFSAFHRIASDEVWNFYDGDPLAIEILHPGGDHERRNLGPGGPWQTVVPAGAAFASHVPKPGGHALVGCDVAPGFEFADFELCERSELIASHPNAATIISSLTRE